MRTLPSQPFTRQIDAVSYTHLDVYKRQTPACGGLPSLLSRLFLRLFFRLFGLSLIHILFFVVGVMRTCGSFAEVKKPEHALKLFIRFAIAKGVVTYGLELMMALFNIVQGLVSTIMNAAGFGTAQQTVLPQEIVTAVESCGFFESIPLWAVTLIGGLFITILSFIMIMTVYGRFFKLYLYTAIARCV